MPRTKRIIHRLGNCVVLERVKETYYWKQAISPDTTIRWDGSNLWYKNGCSWYGAAPDEADKNLMRADTYRRTFDVEADYS